MTKARVKQLNNTTSLPKFKPSAKLFNVAKELVKEVEKSKGFKTIKKKLGELEKKNNFSGSKADCFYVYPKYSKSPYQLLLKSLVSNSNGKKINPNAITSSYGLMSSIMLNEPAKVVPSKKLVVKPQHLTKKQLRLSKRPVKKAPKKAPKKARKVAKKSKKTSVPVTKKGLAKKSNLIYRTTLIGAAYKMDLSNKKRNIGCMIIIASEDVKLGTSPYLNNKILSGNIIKFYNERKSQIAKVGDKRKKLPASKTLGKVKGKIARFAPKKIPKKENC